MQISSFCYVFYKMSNNKYIYKMFVIGYGIIFSRIPQSGQLSRFHYRNDQMILIIINVRLLFCSLKMFPELAAGGVAVIPISDDGKFCWPWGGIWFWLVKLKKKI